MITKEEFLKQKGWQQKPAGQSVPTQESASSSPDVWNILDAPKTVAAIPPQSGAQQPQVSTVTTPSQAADKTKSASQQQTVSQQTPAKVSNYDDVLARVNSVYPIETPEEAKKREKRERAQSIIAAVSDGLSAMSNLYFTTKGAKNAYTGTNTLSAANEARRERLLKEREANNANHLNAYMKLLSEKRAASLADLQRRKEERLERETQIRKEKADAYNNYYAALASKNYEQAAYWKAKADSLERGDSLAEAYNNARIAKERALANAANARADKSRGDNRRADEGKTVEKEEEKTNKDGSMTISKSTTTTKPAGGSSGGVSGGGKAAGNLKPLPKTNAPKKLPKIQ